MDYINRYTLWKNADLTKEAKDELTAAEVIGIIFLIIFLLILEWITGNAFGSGFGDGIVFMFLQIALSSSSSGRSGSSRGGSFGGGRFNGGGSSR